MRAHFPGFEVLESKLRLLREPPVLDKSFFSKEGKLGQGQSTQSQGQEGEADTSRLGVSWHPAGQKNLEATGSTWTSSPWSPQSPFSVRPVWDFSQITFWDFFPNIFPQITSVYWDFPSGSSG